MCDCIVIHQGHFRVLFFTLVTRRGIHAYSKKTAQYIVSHESSHQYTRLGIVSKEGKYRNHILKFEINVKTMINARKD